MRNRNCNEHAVYLVCRCFRKLPHQDFKHWVLYHTSLNFTTLGTYSVYWALTMCQIMHKISGWRQHTIAIVMATHSQSPLAGAPVLCFSQGGRPFVKHRSFYAKLVTLLPWFSCLLRIVSMHDQAIIVGCSYVQWNVPGCKRSLACWHAEAAWVLAIIGVGTYSRLRG